MLFLMKKKFHNPRERFLEIAESRTNSIIEKIRILGNCSNKQLYKYQPDEVYKIFRTIYAELDKAKTKFRMNERKKRFKL